MSHLQRLLLTLVIIAASLAAGWLIRFLAERDDRQPSWPGRMRSLLQTLAIYIFMPLSAALSLWGLPQPDIALAFLPFLGLAAYIWGGALAVFAGRLMRMRNRELGSYFCCGSFTNIGAIGGLVCLLFLGENTIALTALYRLLEEIYYFSIAFPIARWFGNARPGERLGLTAFKPTPALLIIIGALFLGIALNLLKIPRPAACGPVASAALITATVFLLLSIGLALRLSTITSYIWPAVNMSLLKYLGIPMLILPLGMGLGLGWLENGLILKTVLILCSMPVAMTALIPPALFRLNVDLANACWIVSTAALVIWLPFLIIILPYI